MLREEKKDLFWELGERVNVEESTSVRVKGRTMLLGEEGLPSSDPIHPGNHGTSGERVQPSPEEAGPWIWKNRNWYSADCSLTVLAPAGKAFYTPRKMKCAKCHKDTEQN